MTQPTSWRLAADLTLAVAGLTLAACSTGGGGGALSAGLTARMDAPGASLNRADALGIVNGYRAASGLPGVTADAGLDAQAQRLASAYATSGATPKRPEGAVGLRTSAGYATFAETFSGWRNSPQDAATLAERGATRAGLGVAYAANSNYGIYWVLLLDD